MEVVKTYSDDLKPCPFCGSRAAINTFLDDEDVTCVYITCDNCKVSGPAAGTFEYVTDHWNNRT